MPLSHRATFNREMLVWDQASPGVSGTLLATVPCRFVVSRIILNDGWSGPLIWLYVTTESEVPAAPSYGIVGGVFVQSVDFTSATIIADTLTPDVKYMCVKRQIFPFSGETYYRFELVDATLWQGEIPPEDPCETPISIAISTEYDFTTTDPEELWWDIPSGAVSVQAEAVSRSVPEVDYRVRFVGGTCEEPEDLGGFDFIFGEPETVLIPSGTFRLQGYFASTTPGETFTGWIKYLP